MCHCEEHLLQFHKDKCDDEICLSYYLESAWPFWKRVLHAFKYVFGLQPHKWGHFSNTLIRPEDREKLIEFFKEARDPVTDQKVKDCFHTLNTIEELRHMKERCCVDESCMLCKHVKSRVVIAEAELKSKNGG
jgi:hypothetical protein